MSFLLSGNPIIEADGLREVEMPFKPQVSQSPKPSYHTFCNLV